MHLQTFVSRIAALALVAASLAACTTTSLNVPRPGPTATPPVQKPAAMFVRPATGATLARFDGVRNKGLDIAGNLGDPIVASADGRVVYVGGELPAYGNMIIVKHNETYLTAYAHLQTILVKENQVVRQGEKIGEMGRSNTDRVKLRFEIRKNGTAVNPEPYLNGLLQQ
ncbi:murein hydrolase activator EnvC family protein [Variovorax sp. Root411]|uniref:murein hydrolase activator EnvC family protein n=1 Tax=Variovorax sp. Root411 TaxID=1736530 RepID=UPI0006F5A4CC|nr:peptidoglycan DD-metalloendopeptidase family protein [Variovorax sp. Root411]KQW54393.1 peptidase M23 [Variovorax sp. Root411]